MIFIMIHNNLDFKEDHINTVHSYSVFEKQTNSIY